jgi:fructokinase
MEPLYGSIKGGGTKFICAIGSGPNNILAEARFPTTTSKETMTQVMGFFKQQEASLGKIESIGFARFGPLDPNPDSLTFGCVLPTPTPGWTNTNVVGMLYSSFDLPVAFDTDVNTAALGEYTGVKERD